MRPWHRSVAAAVAAGVLAAACGGEPKDGSAEVTVVAAFYPPFEAGERIGGERVTASDLTPMGAEPHDLELTSDEVSQLLDADVVLYAGGGFQPAVEEVVARREGVSVDVLVGVAGEDPHVWLDPVVWGEAVARIAAALAEVDPQGREAFETNAAGYREEIEALDDAFGSALGDCEHDVFVTAHDAFGRLAERYGLRQEPIGGRSPEAEPAPDRLAQLADLIEREGLTTVFAEPLASPGAAEALARETGTEVALLDPVEGLTDEASTGATYVSIMEANLSALMEGLGCG